jgi:YlzJ-like protein
VILWTIADFDTVFEGYSTTGKEYKEIQRGHLTMLVEPTENGYGKIVRLISPNCNDYLDPKLAPGQLVHL